MRIPRWTVYPAIVILIVLGITLVPRGEDRDPYSGAAAAARESTPERSWTHKPVVVLGIDGLDPDLLLEMMEREPERVPNYRWLAAQADGVQELGTACPPQSPVAWSNFITGRDPGGHGVFDFIHRDLGTRGEVPPTVVAEDPLDLWLPGKWKLQLPGDSEEVRQGVPFWKVLAKEGVPADIWRIPANFPATPALGLSFCGMMTPVLDGTYGGATLFTTQTSAYQDRKHVQGVEVFDGKVDAYLDGPANVFQDGDPVTRAHLQIYVDEEAGACAIDTGMEVVVLEPGQWSEFAQVSFSLLPAGAMDMVGSVRFYLRTLEPRTEEDDPVFELYASPVNIDASAPATPVSAPDDASAELAEAIGLYYTQGMPDDVGSLKSGLIDDGEFLQQVDIVYDERMEMLDYALDRYVEKGDGGLLFFYFSTVDLTSHMMWRHSDEHHPHYEEDLAARDSSEFARHEGATWATTIYDVIAKTDPALGNIREKLGNDVTIVVMSDHGFAPYRWKFNLNAWLLEHGYLVLREGAKEQIAGMKISSVFNDGDVVRTVVDWEKTRAYGIGFNGLYLNLKDREEDDPRTEEDDESGIVERSEADALLAEIKAELEAYEVDLIDPLTQEQIRLRPVKRCDLTTEVYSAVETEDGGLIRDGGPDMVVGYDALWGNSDEATVGEIMARYVPPRGGEPGRVEGIVVQPNKGGTFNGSHLMAPDVVPGILLANRKVRPGDHKLEDLTVEVLRQYGLDPGEHMTGHAVLE